MSQILIRRFQQQFFYSFTLQWRKMKLIKRLKRTKQLLCDICVQFHSHSTLLNKHNTIIASLALSHNE